MNNPKINILYFILSIACQLLGFTAANFINNLIPNNQLPPAALIAIFVLSQSVTAFLLATFLKLSKAWCYFNLFLGPAILLYEFSNLPSFILLSALALTLLIYLPTFWTRIPYYPTSLPAYEIIAKLVSENKPKKFIDLGSGFAPLLVYLAKKYPEIEFHGSEISLLPYLVSKLRALTLQSQNLHITRESFWNINLAEYDFVYAFLAPPPMERLWNKVQSEMNKDSVFVSNTFEVPAKPTQIYNISDKKKAQLFVHVL